MSKQKTIPNRRAVPQRPTASPHYERKQWRRADKLIGLPRPESKLMNHLAAGWRLVVTARSVKRVRGSTQKVDRRDFLALVKRGLLDLAGAVTSAGRDFLAKFGLSIPEPKPVQPILSVSDWNALPAFATGKPASYMALTSEGHLVIQQKRVLAAGNSLSDSEALQRAAANIGKRAVTAQVGA